MKFDGGPLAFEQNSYVTKIVNAYIVYDWHPTNIFRFENCLFDVTNIVKKIDKKVDV